MDYGALPPEVNSARMYAGPGAESMLAAAAGWAGLAAELRSAASSYGSVISGLTTGPWLGPSATAMAAAAAPYVTWMGATASQAELAASQAEAAAGAFEAAFAATVPPPEIAVNRAQLMMLVATNFFGQNTPAIAATEAQYSEMWAQDAGAMYGYAANSAAATANVTPFSSAPQTTNATGLAAQGASAAQVGGSSTDAGVQSALSQLISSISGTLQNLASPFSSASTGASAAATVSPFGGVTSTLSDFSLGGVATGLVTQFSYLPAFMGMFMANSALGPLLGAYAAPMNAIEMNAVNAAAAGPLGAGAAAGAAAAQGPLGSGFLGGLGGLAGLGQAASVGGLAVPPSWGWAAGGVPASTLAQLPVMAPAAAPLAGENVAAGLGFPVPFGGLSRAAAVGAGIGLGAAAAKYGPRLRFVARPPAAGYSAESEIPPTPPPPPMPKYPVPAGLPTNGHAPPGYQPALVYLPVNGHATANT